MSMEMRYRKRQFSQLGNKITFIQLGSLGGKLSSALLMVVCLIRAFSLLLYLVSLFPNVCARNTNDYPVSYLD